MKAKKQKYKSENFDMIIEQFSLLTLFMALTSLCCTSGISVIDVLVLLSLVCVTFIVGIEVLKNRKSVKQKVCKKRNMITVNMTLFAVAGIWIGRIILMNLNPEKRELFVYCITVGVSIILAFILGILFQGWKISCRERKW